MGYGITGRFATIFGANKKSLDVPLEMSKDLMYVFCMYSVCITESA